MTDTMLLRFLVDGGNASSAILVTALLYIKAMEEPKIFQEVLPNTIKQVGRPEQRSAQSKLEPWFRIMGRDLIEHTGLAYG